ncbi:MAG: thymidine kinase [Bacteroidales bacterium]|nr:thymidine kinase [Bacteroidales bacterium]
MFLEPKCHAGSIEVISGSMFSGKTEELIRRLRRAQIAGLKTAIFKPSTDTRYSQTAVVSHDKHSVQSIVVTKSSDILALADDAQVIGIDEAQFFDNELPAVCRTLAFRGARVIAAGLDMDYLGRPFGPMGAMMSIADDVTKVHAICSRCGSVAQFSHRLSADDKLVSLGEKNTYEPLCRECYAKVSQVKELVNDTCGCN